MNLFSNKPNFEEKLRRAYKEGYKVVSKIYFHASVKDTEWTQKFFPSYYCYQLKK